MTTTPHARGATTEPAHPRGPLRRRAGEALFIRVSGPDGFSTRDRIHHSPGPRWFPPGSAVQVVHGDASMFVGGLRALLLQALHPVAMAAVASFSDFREDPWGRLARTSTFLAMTAFGTADDAEAAVQHVRRVHGYVRGVTPDGVPFSADDPHLLAWIHAAGVDSFVTAHRTFGLRPLDGAGYDEYVAQSAVVARGLGVVDPPLTIADVGAVLRSYRPELRSTDASRETVDFLLRTPPLPLALRPAYAGLAAGASATLPVWARAELGLRPRPPFGGVPARAAGQMITRSVRWLLPPVE
ncbi:oxygenase MpaB family protein [Cellulomonas sp. URHB0016]